MQASGRNKRRPRSRYAVLGMLSMGLESALRDTPGRYPDQPCWPMTLRCGRAVREAERVWCDETLEHLQGTRSGRELTSESGLGL